DIDVLLLDKTGTITIGNRKATHLYPANGVDENHFIKCVVLSSMSDETPEGKSIVELTRINPLSYQVSNPKFINFTAETRSSGIDFE
ncbi:potassium-transporting ATPase subunit B, partial [Acinetobacter baumannii]